MLLQAFALMHHSLLYQVNSSKRLLSLDSDPWSHGHQIFLKPSNSSSNSNNRGLIERPLILWFYWIGHDQSIVKKNKGGRGGASEAARRDLKADTV